MSTYFAPISLTLRSRTNAGDTTKGSPLTFAEGDNNLIALKSFTELARSAINNLETTTAGYSQSISTLNSSVSILNTNYGLLSTRVGVLEGYNAGSRLDSLEQYIPTITSLSSTVAGHTTQISNLNTYSMEYFGQVEGGVDASHPFMLNGAEGFRDKAVYRVDSSGWFGVSEQLLTTFAAFGDLIVIDGNYFQVLKTSSIKMTGSSDISVIRNSDESGQNGFTHNRGWVIDLSDATKAKINDVVNATESLDSRVLNLESKIVSPFNYYGTVAGGTEIAPTDVSTFTETTAGSYYKVSVAGYFLDGLVTKFANVGDGILFNSTGSVDIVDNTDTVVSAGSSDVSVTGNTDDGFVVDLSQTLKDRIDTIESNASQVSSLGSRTTALETSVSGLDTRVTALENAGGLPSGGTIDLTTTTTDPDQVIDSVPTSSFSVVKYVAHCTDGTDIRVSEILMTYNGTTTYITEYGKILSTTGNEIASFSCDIDSGNFRLLVTPVAANTVFKLTRTGF